MASSPHLEERLIALRQLFGCLNVDGLVAEREALTKRVVAADGADEANTLLLAYTQALLALKRLHTSLVEVGVDVAMEFDPVDTIAELQVGRLTPREVQVRDLIANGLSNAEVAHHLRVSANTVKAHVASVLRKHGASSRLDIIRLCGTACELTLTA